MKAWDTASSECDGHPDSATVSYFIAEGLQVHTKVDLFLQAMVCFPEWIFFSPLNFSLLFEIIVSFVRDAFFFPFNDYTKAFNIFTRLLFKLQICVTLFIRERKSIV